MVKMFVITNEFVFCLNTGHVYCAYNVPNQTANISAKDEVNGNITRQKRYIFVIYAPTKTKNEKCIRKKTMEMCAT